MAIKTFSKKEKNIKDIVKSLKQELSDFNPLCIIFFSSSNYDNQNPCSELKAAFPNCKIIGCTSHSEYCLSSFLNDSISIMAFDKESISDVYIDIVKDVSKGFSLDNTIKNINEYFGGYDEILNNFDKYVGTILFESSSKIEEKFMDKLGVATDILFVGGTSSNTLNGISKVYFDGQGYTDAVVIAVFKTVLGYDILKTQSAEVLSDKTLKVTKSDMKNRIIYELDNHPIKEAYADVLGVSTEEIGSYFVSNPFGVVAEDEIFIRTCNEIQSDGSISLHCAIPENTEINVLKIGNIIQDTKTDLESVITEPVAGIINFNCLYRTFEIINKNIVQEYCNLFGKYNSIGFSTSGEAFLGHINETSTVLIIK